MPRAPKAIKRPPCRPLLDVDWKVVDEYLETGCPGTKIADAIGISADTLYDRCEKEKGVTFTVYSQQKRTKGDALLHKLQFDKAKEGDTSLLIFLGKVRLEQRETVIQAATPEQEKNYRMVIDQLADLQKSRQTISIEVKTQENSNELDLDKS